MLIKLIITNTENLDGRIKSSHLFDETGGVIGSNEDAAWYISERASLHGKRVMDKHAEIYYVNNLFCIRQMSGEVFINMTVSPLGKGKLAHLKNEDLVRIGSLKIRVLYVNNKHEATSVSASSLEEILHHTDSHESGLLDEFTGTHKAKPTHANFEYQIKEDFVMENYDKTTHKADVDPISALEKTEKRGNKGHGLLIAEAHEEDNASQTITELNTHEDIDMEVRRLMSLKENNSSGEVNPENNDLYKILEVLGLQVGTLGLNQKRQVILDIAKSLAEVVIGLNKIFFMENTIGTALSSLRFQPIEDNPIRTSDDIDSILSELFTGKERYATLSAPAAIKESMDIMYNHHVASERALDSALTALLDSFNPDILLKRFERYRPMDDFESKDAWAWMMYHHYYIKLAGTNRLGFSQTFKDIFSQVYDKEMRNLQQEKSNEKGD